MVASDPHMPYEAASSFFEVHLSGGSFDVAGAGLIGLPGLTFGRTRTLAWGITNNICSLRDLYLERAPDAVIGEREETIEVAGADPVTITVQQTQHGPIVDRILPPAAAPEGPISLRWVGQLDCDWIAAQLRLDRAGSIEEAFTAIEGWLAPTFSLVLGEASGRIAYHATGAVPIRERPERGYRDGANPDDEWAGLIPPDGMPHVVDPARGWIATANNRPAPEDYPVPALGHVGRGPSRAARGRAGPADGRATTSSRSGASTATCCPSGRATTATTSWLRSPGACRPRTSRRSTSWPPGTRRRPPIRPAPLIWEVVLARWQQAAAAERLPSASADYVAGFMPGFARQPARARRRGLVRLRRAPARGDRRDDPRRPGRAAVRPSAPTRRAGAGATSTSWRRATR